MLTALFACVIMSADVVGQNPPNDDKSEAPKKPITAQTHPNNPELWNVDAMMEDAVLQITRRYNLNKAQENYTRLLLTKRTRAFLEVHEADVRELLKESIDLRTGAKPSTIDAYVKWASRAAPIYAAAAKAILEGNEEWRVILNEEQKKTHDADLSLMRTNFDQITKVMDDWQSGITPAGRKPGVEPVEAGPSRLGNPPPQKSPSQVTNPPVQVVRQTEEDSWLAYVNLFVDAYKLDEKQAVAARDKIHKDTREQAVKYRDKHRADFDAAQVMIRLRPKEGAKRKEELEKPIRRMFIEMDERLHQLLDRKQRAAGDAEKIKSLDAIYATLAGQPRGAASAREDASSAASQPASRPATTQPADHD